MLKGHDNRADFLGFLLKLVPHRSLTLPFEPFCFWLQIRGDNQKNNSPTRRVGDSPTLRVRELLTLGLGESALECLKESSVSRKVGDFPTWGVAMVSWGVEFKFKFF